MAGESLSLSELKDWYAKFDAVVTNYGGGALSKLGVPDGGTVVTSDINNLYNQITAFRNDTYFKTQPTLYATDYSIVSAGTKILRSQVTPISTTVTGIAKIKCRNDAAYNHGTNSHGTNRNVGCSQGDNAETCSRKADCWNVDNSNNCSSTCSRNCSHGDNGRAPTVSCSHSTNGNTCSSSCSHGDNANTSRSCSYSTNSRTCSRCWNIPNVNSSTCIQTINSKTTNTSGTNSETCTRTCSSGDNAQTCSRLCSRGTNSQTCSRNCTSGDNAETCSRTCSVACTYGDYGNNCSNAYSCSHGDNAKTCSHGTYGHVALNHVTLSHGTVIDILNANKVAK